MRKSLFPRIVLVCFIYAVAFIGIAVLQFARQDNFNLRIGSLLLTGKYQLSKKQSAAANEMLVEDAVSVFFGGLEFRLESGGTESTLALIDFDEIRRPVSPEIMLISVNSAQFRLSGGSVLEFYVQKNGQSEDLIINAQLAENAISLELPYRLTKNARVDSYSSPSGVTILHNNQKYTFDRSIVDSSRQLIEFNHKNPVLSYRVLQGKNSLNPANFIISGAMGKQFYDDIVRQYCEKALFDWNSTLSPSSSEEQVVAYIAESARHFNYNRALANVPAAFKERTERSYLVSPYMGQLEDAARNMMRLEEEKLAAFEKVIKTDTAELLKQHKLFEFLLQRSKNSLFDAAISSVKSIVSSSVVLADCAGIFEGWWAYETWNKGNENPFDSLANQARLVLSDYLLKEYEVPRVFVAQDNNADVLFNIRLGMALADYSALSGNAEWAAVGRSLVISAISFAADDASLPAAVSYSGGVFAAPEGIGRIVSSAVYPYLVVSDYYPHAVGAGTVMFGVWLWTASPSIGASYKNNALEFAVNFPLESTHYMMICGMRPFSRIQMRGMDYRPDPRFETYDSPGWIYLPEEQILLLKLVHKSEIENIKIYFTQ